MISTLRATSKRIFIFAVQRPFGFNQLKENRHDLDPPAEITQLAFIFIFQGVEMLCTSLPMFSSL